MRFADRPHGKVPLLPHEKESDYKDLHYPGVHSFRAGRMAAIGAYKMAGIRHPLEDLDVIELHDAYTSSELQSYEDLGLCKYGEGGRFIDGGHSALRGKLPVNPSAFARVRASRRRHRLDAGGDDALAVAAHDSEALRQRQAPDQERPAR